MITVIAVIMVQDKGHIAYGMTDLSWKITVTPMRQCMNTHVHIIHNLDILPAPSTNHHQGM